MPQLFLLYMDRSTVRKTKRHGKEDFRTEDEKVMEEYIFRTEDKKTWKRIFFRTEDKDMEK